MKFKPLVLSTLVLSLFVVLLLAVPVTAEALSVLLLPSIGSVNVSNTLSETFDRTNSWENYSSLTGVELGVENGIYRAYTANSGYVWGLNAQEQTDVVAEVEVTPLTVFTDVGVGLMCRASPSNNGDGYYFMINPNGYYSIRIGQGDDIAALVDWQPSKAVRTGIDQNTIRAVCLNDQLAMYVNNELVAHVVDGTYSEGYTGLAVAAGDNGVDMAFDNLTLYTVESR